MSKIILISFADTKFKPTGERLRKEAEAFDLFDSINILSEKDFEQWYRRKYWLRLLAKGMGYWMWKSYLVKRFYNTLDKDDILFYVDAGCVLNIQAKNKFLDYIQEVIKSNSGILVFQQSLVEKQYSKADLLKYLGVNDDPQITESGQIYAGAFFLKKGQICDGLINQVYDICHDRIDLLSDKPSSIPNSNDFVAHKYDQSVFSISVKKCSPIIHSAEETYALNNQWDKFSMYPIQARRLKSYNNKGYLLYRIKTPIRITIDWLVSNNLLEL